MTTRGPTLALALLAAGCSATPAPAGGAADGIYVVDRSGGDPIRLAAVHGDSSPIKFGVLDHGDGTFDVAYVQDDERTLYALQATQAGSGAISATTPRPKLVRSDRWSLNGPAYCQARDELAVGIWQTTAVEVDAIDAGTLRAMPASTVDQALDVLVSLEPEDFHVASDVTCGNLPSGVVYNSLDCSASASVDACLATPGTSRIAYKPSPAVPARPLTFPAQDADVVASPPTALDGDNGPAVVVADDGSMHVMFERNFDNATSAADPEFQPFGFNKLMYKHVVGDPSAATEYELDFSRWLPRPAPREIVNSSSVRIADGMVDFVALGVFKAPSPSSPYDDTVYMGIVAGQFDAVPTDSRAIVLDPARVQNILTFDRFTCYAWRTYGMAPDGREVDMYALAYPLFLTLPGGDRVAFSATKYMLGTLAGDVVTYTDGNSEPADQLLARVCALP